MSPFLTIVTRACDRPFMLAKNITSVRNQTDQSIEQIFIVDKARRGRHHANCSFRHNIHRIDGDYVFILDDDCRLIRYDFVAMVKEGIGESCPDVIMVQTSRPQHRPKKLPKKDVWGSYKNIRMHSTNCLCYIVRRELWQRYIYGFCKGAAGDWHFLKEVKRNTTADKYAWVPGVFSETMQLGRGVKFELKQNIKGWWEKTVEEHGIEDLGEGDWRLRLWQK